MSMLRIILNDLIKLPMFVMGVFFIHLIPTVIITQFVKLESTEYIFLGTLVCAIFVTLLIRVKRRFDISEEKL